MKSNSNQSAAPRPPEFELPHENALADNAQEAAGGSSLNHTSDRDIVRGIITFADREEYVDES